MLQMQTILRVSDRMRLNLNKEGFAGSEYNETSDQMNLDTSDATKCIAQCCLNYEKAFQPLDLAEFESQVDVDDHNNQPS